MESSLIGVIPDINDATLNIIYELIKNSEKQN